MGREVGTFYLQIICRSTVLFLIFGFCFGSGLLAQEPPYFVTYSDVMEEPGNLTMSRSPSSTTW
jgi:hypothetical protein